MVGMLQMVARDMAAELKGAGVRFLPPNAFRFRTFMSCTMSASDTLDGEIEVEIVYSVRPGCDPAHDDPGSPPEITVHALRTANTGNNRIDLTWMGTDWIADDEEMRVALLADAADQREHLADQAADARREELRDGD